MNEIIIVKPEKCVGCNACVRNCPAPEANITKMLEEGRFVTTVNPERCITCGECVRTCNHGARDYIDDTETCISRLGKEEVIILVAPAIKSVLPDKWKGILDWFRKNGCKIYDVSLGADICTWAHLRAIEERSVGNVITQPCAAIVKYIEIYQPRLLRNLSPIHSPIACAATYIRKYMRQDNPIAVLSPCIAKKTEFMETGLVNYSITFRKLMEYFEKNDIKIPTDSSHDFSYPFENQQGQVGAVYPRPGGLRDNLWLHNPDINITTSEGVHKVYPELDMYANMPEYKHPEVFDVLSCEFGCNVGPASGTTQTVFDVMATMREVEKEAKKRRKTTGPFRFGEDKLFK
ncbi:MAG: 4Fe-4S dicluster domain-containing protein, partial [Ruminococcus sp.]|nr:4Fe-4S dicluster domain-containing protein [Ruminococcus sp.]